MKKDARVNGIIDDSTSKLMYLEVGEEEITPARFTTLTAAQFATYTGQAGEIVEVTDEAGRPQYRWDGTQFVSLGGGGGGADPEGWTAIETVEWSSPLSAIDIALPFGADYKELRISGHMTNLRAGLAALFSVDGGVSYETSKYGFWYNTTRNWGGASDGQAYINQSFMWISLYPIGDADSGTQLLDIRVGKPVLMTAADGAAYFCQMQSDMSGAVGPSLSDTPSYRTRAHSAHRHASNPQTHIRLYPNNGYTVAAGKLFVMGR